MRHGSNLARNYRMLGVGGARPVVHSLFTINISYIIFSNVRVAPINLTRLDPKLQYLLSDKSTDYLLTHSLHVADSFLKS